VNETIFSVICVVFYTARFMYLKYPAALFHVSDFRNGFASGKSGIFPIVI